MGPKKRKGAGKGPRFGGDWTNEKLNVIAKYLASYTTALRDKPSKEHPFHKAYIDAFAGTGYREAREDHFGGVTLLLPDLAEKEPQALLDGSARLALRTEPRFERYIFIEKSPQRCAQLEALKSEFPHLADDIQIRRGDANVEIQELCRKDWRSRRAVLFLDPYGLQVEWTTIEAIAITKAIDLWLLFPLGIGVNRMLTKSGDIPESWRRRLDALLGTKVWYDEFYRVESIPTLFGGVEERVVKATTETIGRYFKRDYGQYSLPLRRNQRSYATPPTALCTCFASPSAARTVLPSHFASPTTY